MERMRELVQQTTSGSTELAASAEQMSKMSRELLNSMDRFAIDQNDRGTFLRNERSFTASARHASAGSRG
jgi:hypothetical protein